MRRTSRPLFAIVQLRKQKDWVLPKGKLNRKETALAAARREALEETGHEVTVHEFLGTLAYASSGRPKIVKFWRMQADPRPVGKLMNDVRAVRWLPLGQALKKLTHERERLFLEKMGPIALARAATPERRKTVKTSARPRQKDVVRRLLTWLRP